MFPIRAALTKKVGFTRGMPQSRKSQIRSGLSTVHRVGISFVTRDENFVLRRKPTRTASSQGVDRSSYGKWSSSLCGAEIMIPGPALAAARRGAAPLPLVKSSPAGSFRYANRFLSLSLPFLLLRRDGLQLALPCSVLMRRGPGCQSHVKFETPVSRFKDPTKLDFLHDV